ncbi:hypothetical protein LNQ49_11355 [Flavobacterium sp. F-65]|uniref:DUF2490 domain-containing protein n=1 Tax=Flavobacterium pisciphilum TaxID=2893755 RepID=A0ABS8MTR4_9FLAO|nr:hypothetical protein [Flavobacterium sp. F-65]MCC9072177.1 hypothetical protein [Flavobacterium sp. F-65]
MAYSFPLIFIALLCSYIVGAQKIAYQPEFITGDRSVNYTHNASYSFNDYFKLSNLTLFDTDYNNDKDNIFFIRNTLSYKLSDYIVFNAAMGVKNPGKFTHASAQFQLIRTDFSLIYLLGTTYQAGYTVEQSLNIQYTPQLTDKIQLYIKAVAVANINKHEYQRGFQWFRFGMSQQKMTYGLALNLDQFHNSTKTLKNAGLFIKFNN